MSKKVAVITVPLSPLLSNILSKFGVLPFLDIPKIKAEAALIIDKHKKEIKKCFAQKVVSHSETVSGIFTGLAVGAAARKSKMSLYSALINTGVSCVGGSTLYSLIRNEPPGWVSSPAFLAKCLAAGGLGYYDFFKEDLARPWVRKIADGADLVALGGAAVAAGKEIVDGKGNYVTAALGASLYAIGGELCRDLITTRKLPSALYPHAKSLVVPPIVGAWVYPLIYKQHDPNITALYTIATTIGLHHIISKKENEIDNKK